MICKRCFSAVVLSLAAVPAYSVQIAVDSFEKLPIPGGYTTGSLPGQNPTTSEGFVGAWQNGTTATGTWQVSSNNISLSSPSPIETAGSHVFYSGAAPSGIRRVFRDLAPYTTPTVGTPTYWTSGLLRLDAVDTAGLVLGGFTSGGVTDTNFFSGSGQQIQGVMWGFEGNGTGNDLVVRYRDQNGLQVTETLISNVDVGVGEGHFLIAKIEKDIAGFVDRLSVWLDPTGFGSEAALGAPTFVDSSTAVLIQDVGLTRLTLASQDFASMARFDEFRFGTTLRDVAPIPEPATAVLGMIAVASLVRRRRRMA